MTDKQEAIINYILQCPQIKDTQLYFNFINAKDNTSQIVTTANDRFLDKPYITGSVEKQYSFRILIFKSITDDALVKLEGFAHENVEELAYVQALIDWISEQNELKNLPDFGEECDVDGIETSAETPRLEGINMEVAPPLAMYSVTIRIHYVDNSKNIWR